MVPVCLQHIFICSYITVVTPCLNLFFFSALSPYRSVFHLWLHTSVEHGRFLHWKKWIGHCDLYETASVKLVSYMIFWTGIKGWHKWKEKRIIQYFFPKLSAFYLLYYPSLIQELFCCLELLYACLSEFSCQCAYRFNITLIFYK